MSGKKLLLITFDYELFLGEKSGTPKDCLIDPTDKLLACLEKYKFRAIFFVDTVYLLCLKKIAENQAKAKKDLAAIFSQLVQIVNSGHEIHPHIHPHWMDAQYDERLNEWSLKQKEHYTFASLTDVRRRELFDQSIQIIRSILDLAKSGQSIDSYRAGGWSIEPFAHFRALFIHYGTSKI